MTEVLKDSNVNDLVEIRKRSNINCFSSFALLGVILLSLIPSSEGSCYTVRVSNAYNYNGYYSLNDYYYGLSSICDGNTVWGDDYQYGQYVHYLSYKSSFYFQGTYQSGWVIRDFGCGDTLARVWAFAPGYYYTNPYDVPKGGWYQWNPSSGLLEPNIYLVVDCYNDALSAWAITGIVIGCLCGAALLIGIIAVICSKSKKKRQANTSRPPPPPPQVVYTTTTGVATTTVIGGTTGYIDPIYSTPINPPAYDNSPPPAYHYNANSAV